MGQSAVVRLRWETLQNHNRHLRAFMLSIILVRTSSARASSTSSLFGRQQLVSTLRLQLIGVRQQLVGVLQLVGLTTGSYFVRTEPRPISTFWKPHFYLFHLFLIIFRLQCWISGVHGFQGFKTFKRAKKSVESGQV